jgi:anaerobic dimethyl sulfoxide reductase subunit C (anchor subunit)
MPGRSWQLVVFTLSAQLAVGIVTWLAVLRLWAWPRASETALGPLLDTGLACVLMLLVLGSAVAARHLGRPGGMWRALANLRQSGLSQEVLAGLSFGLLCLLTALLRWTGAGPVASAALLVLASAAGLALVYVISSVYRLPTVPAWNRPATPLSFFATALLLGAAATGVLLLLPHEQQAAGALPLLSWVAVTLVALQLALGPAAASAGAVLPGLRSLSAVLGAGLLMAAAYSGPASPRAPWMTVGALLALLGSELLGRVLFYRSYRRVGL